ncbi:hypothetical protein ERO13_D07G153901v2 [Gossypium hirsutum]|uniref:Zinc knuckle CX2CX4HX4C domain-containing protein n=3 Tax=Gossypium TaxID=3633 RepID=A0A5D2UAB7_GOSMU|nr:hypothetical protein ERO13_D07G153901v2 [Gossypium hirsutum]TYG61795.1 hypothetical protein ES288_D07G177700v1 [Gossypium darwinii]TYH63209.1 hypothetical protein ES332_D07G174900v1 [Gossypium tomentosum]TYI74008.1 hypothetical protein E1A91_D07G169600v1 [Gossypium mustelinum]
MRVRPDIQAPLKRRKKNLLSPGNSMYVRFCYEKSTLFCYLCGCLGHGDSFCPIQLTGDVTDSDMG